MAKSVNPKIYDRNFYLNQCLGSYEFNFSDGKKLHPTVQKLIKTIPLKKCAKILDLGCGRGDITLFLAKKAGEVVGLDYSKEAIKIARETSLGFPKEVKDKTKFFVMNAKNIKYPSNYFDAVICIDVFEHLYKGELTKTMDEISRVLKKGGLLFVHTNTNKLLYDFTYKYYIYPVNKILTFIDQKLKNIVYKGLPKDPRTEAEKQQHVNEPTYFYLNSLFTNHLFKGKIKMEIGYLKEVKNMRSVVYNFLVTLYPLSKIFPISLLFCWAFTCIMRNNKSS